MAKSRFTPKKEKITLEYSQVLNIAQKVLVDKIPCRNVAKEMLISPRIVTRIVAAMSHREMWIDAIAELAREGKLDG